MIMMIKTAWSSRYFVFFVVVCVLNIGYFAVVECGWSASSIGRSIDRSQRLQVQNDWCGRNSQCPLANNVARRSQQLRRLWCEIYLQRKMPDSSGSGKLSAMDSPVSMSMADIHSYSRHTRYKNREPVYWRLAAKLSKFASVNSQYFLFFLSFYFLQAIGYRMATWACCNGQRVTEQQLNPTNKARNVLCQLLWRQILQKVF